MTSEGVVPLRMEGDVGGKRESMGGWLNSTEECV